MNNLISKWKIFQKKMPLKKSYYISFGVLVVIPLLSVLCISLIILNKEFRKQSIENIQQMQQTIVAELISDVDNMSMRMSSLIYANNNEMLQYAALTNTEDTIQKNANRKKLSQMEKLYLEPEKNILSLYFYMKDGENTYLKSYINRTKEEIENTIWYQAALKDYNHVYIGSYDTKSSGDLYIGGGKDIFVLVFALAPDRFTDKYEKIEMVELYQTSRISQRIRENNKNYLNGKNKLGITRIVDENGACIYTTVENEIENKLLGYECIRTKVELPGNNWVIENYVKSSELTSTYWKTAGMVLTVVVVVLLLMAYYSRFFLFNIVKPIEEVSDGLRQVEEGNLEAHIMARGQYEIRSMIHQFNAMVRRLHSLINDYEEKVKNANRNSSYYFSAIMQGTMSLEEARKSYAELFVEPYSLIGITIRGNEGKKKETVTAKQLIQSFEKNLRYSARCYYYIASNEQIYLYYRINEEDYLYRQENMLKELIVSAEKEFGITLFACIGNKQEGWTEFPKAVESIQNFVKLRYLFPETGVFKTDYNHVNYADVLEMAEKYTSLANALYTADEKNMINEREALFLEFQNSSLEQIKEKIYAVIVAIGIRCSINHDSLSGIMGQQVNYIDKVDRLMDGRSMRLWITNYFEWIYRYTSSKLGVTETDMIVKAKRYIQDHYEDSTLSLGTVAAYVGLNEKYFTSRFSKEAGETFSTYLTEIRMQKAKEYLKSTDYKVYEIAEMVGYQSVEHFNRVFKKECKESPTQYRKGKKQ